MTTQANFRQRLDTALRTLDVTQVRNFLIAEGQWDEDAPADPEFAMWIMIAGSPALRDLHTRAHNWLINHGHEAEAAALQVREKKQAPRTGQAKKGQPQNMRRSQKHKN